MKKRKGLFNLVAALSLVVANLGAGVACWGFLYQPELPKQLKK